MSSSVQTHVIEAAVHGRYLVRPAAGAAAAPLLVGFHGYGENADTSLEAILEIPGVADWHVVAIQGLHPFYRGRSGEVVATWMTKLDREAAIHDNVRFVGSVLAALAESLEIEGARAYLGFSQGAAMAYRAAAFAGYPVAGLVALAGDCPPEIGRQPLVGFPRVLIGRGTDDEWYSDAKMHADIELLSARDVVTQTSVFNAGHEWTAEFRHACARFLRTL